MNLILSEFEKNAEAFADKTAISDENSSYSFFQLLNSAKAEATLLSDKINTSRPVAVWAHHTCDTLLAFLAVMYSGGFYLPLDPEMPQQRLESILQSAQPCGFLGKKPEHIQIELNGFNHIVHRTNEKVTSFKSDNAQQNAPLYLIYTSGSTGKPKGVLKGADAMHKFLKSFDLKYPLSETDILGNQTPFYFDASAKDFFWTLFYGCTMVILKKQLFSMPVKLIEELNNKKVTVISWVPSALSIMSQLDVFSLIKPQYLRRVMFVGEVFQVRHLLYWKKHLAVQYINLYGSSELAGVCCAFDASHINDDTLFLPLGLELPGITLILQNENGQRITQQDEPGELVIISDTLALGYYNDLDKTNEVFKTISLNGNKKRAFISGDMAKYDKNNVLQFAARKDFQVKHNGFRIELGEIEAAAIKLSYIKDCACVYDTKRSRIVLFTVFKNEFTIEQADIKRDLSDTLCSYMLPNKIFTKDVLPVTQNGKIDRLALTSECSSFKSKLK